jgi:hypothetical protein
VGDVKVGDKITSLSTDGRVLYGVVDAINDGGPNFRYYTARLSGATWKYGASAYAALAAEGVTWVHGWHHKNSTTVRALRVAMALVSS